MPSSPDKIEAAMAMIEDAGLEVVENNEVDRVGRVASGRGQKGSIAFDGDR